MISRFRKAFRNMPENVNKSPLDRFGLKRPLQWLGLYRPLRKLWVVYFDNLVMKHRIRTGRRLVPEKAFTAKIREAMAALTGNSGPEQLGDYLEFGVYNGTSLSCMYQVTAELGYNHVRLFGFDSFEGLPSRAAKEDENVWMSKQFKCDIEFTREFLNSKNVNWKQVKLIKGWFSETLNEKFIQDNNIKKASIIMIDCDLYSSSLDALRFCEPLIRDEAIILFDDWYSGGLADKNQGEKRAFSEFLEKNPHFDVAPFGSYSDNSLAFRITRRPAGEYDDRPL